MANTLGSCGEYAITAVEDSVAIISGQAFASLLLQQLNLLYNACLGLECLHNAFTCQSSCYKLINGYVPGIRGVCAAAAATASCGCSRCRCSWSSSYSCCSSSCLTQLLLERYKQACCAARFCSGSCGISIIIRLLQLNKGFLELHLEMNFNLSKSLYSPHLRCLPG